MDFMHEMRDDDDGTCHVPSCCTECFTIEDGIVHLSRSSATSPICESMHQLVCGICCICLFVHDSLLMALPSISNVLAVQDVYLYRWCVRYGTGLTAACVVLWWEV